MPNETHNLPSAPQPVAQPSPDMDDEFLDFYVLWRSLRAGKRTILKVTLACGVLATGIGFLTPNIYTATASFVTPRSNSGGMSAVSAQLALLSAGGMASTFKNPGDMYIGILQSNTLTQNMVTRFHLQQVYHDKKMSAAQRDLTAHTAVSPGTKDDIIRINVTDHDPILARDMANAYLDELHAANGRLALTEASQRRLFFEQQMLQEKNALEDAEVELRKTQEQTGLIDPIPQTSVEIDGIAATRANIESREVELAGMLQGSTEQDPAVIRLRGEIAGLKNQLSQMMHGGGSDAAIPTGKVPGLQLEYLRKKRDVSYHETLFDILARQYEAARLDESHDAPMLQIVDMAVLPDSKSGPHRSLFLLGGLLLGFIGSSLWMLFRIRVLSIIEQARNAN